MKTDLKFTDVTPEDDTKYKHNSESETNSPYIVVGTFEGLCPSNTFASFPDEGAHVYGLLDGNLGQMVSFQDTYNSTLRIEVRSGQKHGKLCCPPPRPSASQSPWASRLLPPG